MNTSPTAILAVLRTCHPDLVRLAQNGTCFQVHLLLREIFPDAVPYYDGNHVITKIGERFYDIRGEVYPSRNCEDMRQDPLRLNNAHQWGASIAVASYVSPDMAGKAAKAVMKELNTAFYPGITPGTLVEMESRVRQCLHAEINHDGA